MINFLRIHKAETVLLSIWMMILNIYKICFHVIGVDTEQALLELNDNLNWTLGSERFASALFRKVLMPAGFNYDLAVTLTIVGWLVVGLGYIFCFEKLGLNNRILNMFFVLLFVACPLWAEQNYFVCSVFINVYGMFFTIIAAFLFVSVFMDGGGYKKIFGAVILSVLAIGIYQALLYLLIANCSLFLTLKSYSQNAKLKVYLISGIKCIGLCAFSVILYFICAKMCSNLFYNPLMDYAGHTDADRYISGSVHWFKESVVQCIDYIIEYVIESCDSNYIYGVPECPVIFILTQIFFVYKLMIKKEKKSSIMLTGNILLFLCMFTGAVVLGNAIPVREQFVLPLFVAFDLTLLFGELRNIVRHGDKCIKVINVVITVSCFYALTIWGGKQLLINRADYIRYKSDVVYADNLMREIKDQVGDYADKKIVFIGYNQWELPDIYPKGDVIGGSLFAWDAGGSVGVNYRAYGMLTVCGYSYIKPEIEEVCEIQNVFDVQDMFGSDRVVVYEDDYVVVNLNDF